MNDPIRAALERLVGVVQQDRESHYDTMTLIAMADPIGEALDAARAALAQPEPEGVTDEEIEQEALKNADSDDEYRAFKSGAFFVQERISRPAIKPVPVSERLPGPTDEELNRLLYYEFTTSTGHGERSDPIGFARAVLTRWGRPAIEP